MESQKQLIYEFMHGEKRLLIVLDACRYDTFLENARLLGVEASEVCKVLSSGSCTKDWLLKTFTEPLPATYVTANPWPALVFKGTQPFKGVVDVSARSLRAEDVNLKAIGFLLRGVNLIVHYLQPHPPFIGVRTWLSDHSPRHLAGSTVYELVARSEKARKEFKRAYTENLRYALRNVKLLIRVAKRLGYKVAITSDHSELLGEYAPLKTAKLLFRKNVAKFMKNWLPYAVGRLRVVGHPCGWPGRELYEVPWVTVDD